MVKNTSERFPSYERFYKINAVSTTSSTCSFILTLTNINVIEKVWLQKRFTIVSCINQMSNFFLVVMPNNV